MEEKWALITGSSGGIGGALLAGFASRGYHIYAHARKDSEAFEQKLDGLRSRYEGIRFESLCFDMTDREAMEQAILPLIRERKRVDVLVNNAGMIHSGLFLTTEVQTVRDVFEVNLFSAMELTQLVLKLMIRKKSGSIINLASVGGIHPGAGMCAYGLSKGALIGFTELLSEEVGPYGIRVNAVAPGFVDTQMGNSDAVRQGREQLQGKKGAFARMASPEEIADVVCFLASEEASYINGQVLRIDGGNR